MELILYLKRGALGFLLLSILAFIIFLILTIVNYTVKPIFNFTPFAPTTTYVQPTVLNEALYVTKRCPNDTALTFKTIKDIHFSNFSLSFNCFLDGTYKSTDVPRVLFYFGTTKANVSNNNDLKEYTGNNAIMPNVLDITNTNILSVFYGTNFIIYIDPVKNDLRVGVITADKDTSYLELLEPIENIPINQVFSIAMILTDSFVELYFNNTLATTYKIGSNTNAINKITTLNTGSVLPTSSIFSPIGFIGDTIKVANIQYFDGIITSSQLRSLTNTPLTIIN